VLVLVLVCCVVGTAAAAVAENEEDDGRIDRVAVIISCLSPLGSDKADCSLPLPPVSSGIAAGGAQGGVSSRDRGARVVVVVEIF